MDVPTTIESFMGSLVHETLERLYKDKKFQKEMSKSSLLEFYNSLWEQKYTDDILIVKANQGLTSENYRKMGEKFLVDYYERMKPFEQLTILGIETQDMMSLPDGNRWYVRIDKLACDSDGNYYVCDYKTNSRMKTQQEADADRQLALYSIWVKDKFRDAKSVKLVWHMLAFNKDVMSEKSDEELEKLQKDVCEEIKKIESATEFPRKESGLCNYCIYKSICPSFKHEARLEEKSVEEFKEDEGVKIVDEYVGVKTKLSELKKQEDVLKEKLVGYAKQFDVDAVCGSDMIAKIKEFEKIVMPEDREGFEGLLKKKGLWGDFAMLSYGKLNKGVLEGDVDEEVRDAVGIEKGFRVGLIL